MNHSSPSAVEFLRGLTVPELRERLAILEAEQKAIRVLMRAAIKLCDAPKQAKGGLDAR